jgi:hypothetical protein
MTEYSCEFLWTRIYENATKLWHYGYTYEDIWLTRDIKEWLISREVKEFIENRMYNLVLIILDDIKSFINKCNVDDNTIKSIKDIIDELGKFKYSEFKVPAHNLMNEFDKIKISGRIKGTRKNLSDHDLETIRDIENNCIINIWGYPSYGYEAVFGDKGEVIGEKKEKEKMFDNERLESYMEQFFLDLSLMGFSSEELELDIMDQKEEVDYYPYTKHDKERLKMILDCITNIWEKEKYNIYNSLLREYIEKRILDMNTMLQYKY